MGLIKTLFAVVLAVTLGGAIPAIAAEDEKLLKEEAAKMDRSFSPSFEEGRIVELAKEFGVPESKVRTFRHKKMGWGEITINLAMARQYSKTSLAPLTTVEALEKIEGMRGRKMDWADISGELGFKLGTVVNEVNRGEKLVTAADKRSRIEHYEKQ